MLHTLSDLLIPPPSNSLPPGEGELWGTNATKGVRIVDSSHLTGEVRACPEFAEG